MRVTLAISSMGAGGAERVMATLANRWAAAGHAVTIVSLSPVETDFYELHHAVQRIGLDLLYPAASVGKALAANIRRVVGLRAVLKRTRPDVVISFMDTMNVLALCAAFRLRTPVVISERIDPTATPLGGVWTRLRRLLYGRASTLVVQTDRVLQWANAQGWPVPVVVVRNPLAAEFTSSHHDCPTRRPVVVGVGRLTSQKGFDVLVEAFDRVSGQNPGWRLEIAGEGELKRQLQEQMERCAARDRMALLGRVANTASLFRGARIFVLPSRFEGFPNALLEAMATGCAVVATDCPSGPSEIIRDDENGLLVSVDDAAALANAIGRLMTDESLQRRLGAAARCATEAYSVDTIGRQWDAILADLIVPTNVGMAARKEAAV